MKYCHASSFVCVFRKTYFLWGLRPFLFITGTCSQNTAYSWLLRIKGLKGFISRMVNMLFLFFLRQYLLSVRHGLTRGWLSIYDASNNNSPKCRLLRHRANHLSSWFIEVFKWFNGLMKSEIWKSKFNVIKVDRVRILVYSWKKQWFRFLKRTISILRFWSWLSYFFLDLH